MEPSASQQPGFVPFREGLTSTLKRTVTIALIIGALAAIRSGQIAVGGGVMASALWFSFGGHWFEMFWLNQVRGRLPSRRVIQVVGRLVFWFLSGCILAVPMSLTLMLLVPAKYNGIQIVAGGIGFVIVELFVHAVLLAARGKPSFYDGRG